MHTTPWLMEMISTMTPSKFGKYRVNCIDSTYNFDKSNLQYFKGKRPRMELHVYFARVPKEDMRNIIQDYNEDFVSLIISTNDVHQILLDQQFPNLKKLVFRGYTRIREDKEICEAMVAKHADKLTCFELWGTRWLELDLNIPLVNVTQLRLCEVAVEVGISVLDICRNTVTSLEISNWLNIRPLQEDQYRIPIISYLSLPRGHVKEYFKFITYNSLTVEAMYLGSLFTTIELQLPEFPKLRNLSVCYSDLLHLVDRCAPTLECLIVKDQNDPDPEMFALMLPKLKDVYLINTSPEFTHKILTQNKGNLEFLFIVTKVHNLTELLPTDIELVKVKMVVLQENLHTVEELRLCQQLCPNALIIKEGSRIRRFVVEAQGKTGRYHPDFLAEFLDYMS